MAPGRGKKNTTRPDKAKRLPNMHLAPTPHLGEVGSVKTDTGSKLKSCKPCGGPKQTTMRPDKAKTGPNMHHGPTPYWQTWVLSKPMPAKSGKVTKQGGPKQNTMRPDKAKRLPNKDPARTPFRENSDLSKPMSAKSEKMTWHQGKAKKHHTTR